MIRKLFIVFILLLLPSISFAGASRSFDGSNDCLNSSASWDLSGDDTVTASFWMYWDSFANDDDLALEFSPNLNTNNGSFLLDPNESGTGRFQFAIRANNHSQGKSFTRPSGAAWHHYSFIWDMSNVGAGTDLEAAYVDGTSQSLYTDIGGVDLTGNFGNYTMYFMSRGCSALYGDGDLSHFTLSTVAFTDVDIAQSRWMPELAINSRFAYIPSFGEDSPELEVGGNARTLTVTGATESSAGPPVMFGGGLPL